MINFLWKSEKSCFGLLKENLQFVVSAYFSVSQLWKKYDNGSYTVIPAFGQVLRWRSYYEKDQTSLGNSISGAIEQLLNHLEKKYDR